MSEPWYQDGLRFRCTRCGHCCTGTPGNVWINEEEIAAIAEFRRETVELVRKAVTENWRAYVLVNNRSEGNASLTIQVLNDQLTDAPP